MVISPTTTGRAFNLSDGTEVYIAVDHAQRDRTPAQHALWGKVRSTTNTTEATAAVKSTVTAVRPGRNHHHYEWRIDLDPALLKNLSAGRTLSADAVVCDYDVDGSFSWVAWGRRIGKVGPENRRDMVD